MIKLPVKDRTTIPWMSPHEIPAIKLVLSAWRASRKDHEFVLSRKLLADSAVSPVDIATLDANDAAVCLETIADIDKRLWKEKQNENH